ncbi:MAG: alpha/beta fold hydrolase [Verrucomicrobia bacterium]|nr:alpha/beta fold hydrolase [Verrucomicrobiota bacterium]
MNSLATPHIRTPSSLGQVLAVLLMGLGSVVGADAPKPLHEYREYPSSVDPKLRLFATFECAAPSGILLVNMHGWHGSVKRSHTDNVADPLAKDYFVISPEMRGRGDATGHPDCNGWELQDVIDAVEFARRHYRDRIASPKIVFLSGGSGGGGNVFALLGKFPDTFAAARAYYGISDFALWHVFDRKGEFRDELEGINGKDPKGRPPWIGGSPETNPEAYRSRGGLTTVATLLTPTLVFHGSDDARVPVLHARLWVGAAQGAGRGALVTYHEQAGVGDHRHNGNETREQLAFRNRAGKEFLLAHRTPPVLPERGSFVVAGYLKTARFEVILDSIDRVGRVDYDLAAGRFEVHSESAKRATLRVRKDAGGEWQQSEVECKRTSQAK